MEGGKYKKKINLLGDAAVGKTSLILRFVKNVFGDDYLKTVGSNVYKKNVSIVDLEVRLVIFDIMGEKSYDAVQETAFRGSSAALAVADFTRRETLDTLVDHWLPKYREMASEDAPILLAVNKNDLEGKEIDKEIIDEVASNFDGIYYTSAKTRKNVDMIFKDIGFRSVYQPLAPVKTIEDMISSKEISTPKRLMGILLAYASELGEISYSSKEELLKRSGIDKFSLEEGLPEEEVIEFGDRLVNWYEEHEDEGSAQTVRDSLDRYKKGS